MWPRLSYHDLQHQAGFQGTIEALILDHIQQTWSLLDVLFSDIPVEVSSAGSIGVALLCLPATSPDELCRFSGDCILAFAMAKHI